MYRNSMLLGGIERYILLTAGSTMSRTGLSVCRFHPISTPLAHFTSYRINPRITTYRSSQRTSNMFDINNILQRLIKSSIDSDIWDYSKLKLVDIWLNRFGSFDLLALWSLPNRRTDAISSSKSSNENLEANVTSCTSDLIRISKSNECNEFGSEPEGGRTRTNSPAIFEIVKSAKNNCYFNLEEHNQIEGGKV
jgi:hypothetical protein